MTASEFLASLSFAQTVALAEHCALNRLEFERVVAERDEAVSALIKAEDFNRTLAATFSVSE